MKKWSTPPALLAIVFSMLLILPSTQVQAQSFGKNKVNYEQFDWQFIQSFNFDVYYYGDQDARDLAIFTAETAERSLYQITKELNWQLQNRIRIITYQSHSDFQ
ncbi:MAG: hypothetical protein GF372_09100, partial [Candidatus Marinimicrobia bacterium]|nr:hypothetical protein [Candidatus Neomarinimicrobiota bacterium]